MFTSNVQFGYACPRGGASCPGWFILPPHLPPAQDMGQAVSSVNSYCTIILEYLVVRDINIISVKRRCLYPTFSLVTLVFQFTANVQFGYPCPTGVASCPGWFILPPPRIRVRQCQFLLHHYLGIFSCVRYKHYLHPMFSLVISQFQFSQIQSPVSSVNSYCSIILEYLVVRGINIISVKRRCLYPTFSLVTLVRGVGGKLSRLVYLAPHPVFGSGSVINQFLLHHWSKHLRLTEIKFISLSTKCCCSRWCNKICGLSILFEILGRGKINCPGQLAPHPLSMPNPSECLM